MQNNKQIQSTPELKIIMGIKAIPYCQNKNDRAGFNSMIELVSEGIRGQIQLGKTMQDIGEVFTNDGQ